MVGGGITSPGFQVNYPNTTVYNASPALAYTWYDIDCSAVCGVRQAVLILTVTKDATAGGDYLWVKRKGMSGDVSGSAGSNVANLDASKKTILVVVTDTSGVISFQVNDAVPTYTIAVEAFIT